MKTSDKAVIVKEAPMCRDKSCVKWRTVHLIKLIWDLGGITILICCSVLILIFWLVSLGNLLSNISSTYCVFKRCWWYIRNYHPGDYYLARCCFMNIFCLKHLHYNALRMIKSFLWILNAKILGQNWNLYAWNFYPNVSNGVHFSKLKIF